MINLQPASNQAAVCHPPITHHHLLLFVRMYTGGGSFQSDCLANMLRLGGPALTWQSDGSVVLCPHIQAKYVEIHVCSDSMRSIFAVTDSTAQFKTQGQQIDWHITQMHYQAIQMQLRYHYSDHHVS